MIILTLNSPSVRRENGYLKANATETVTDPTNSGKQTNSFHPDMDYNEYTFYVENGSDGQIDVQLQSSPDGGTTWINHGTEPSKQISSGADDVVTLSDAVEDIRLDISGTSGSHTGDVNVTMIAKGHDQS